MMLNAIWAANTAINTAIPVLNNLSDRSMSETDIGSAVSNLENALKPLEKSLDVAEGWLIGFTVLVVVGLVVEYWDDVRELCHIRWAPKWTFAPLDIDPVSKLTRAVVGGILVTIGVAGELNEEFNASGTEVSIRDDNGKINSLLELEAANVSKRAAQIEADVAPRDLSESEKARILSLLKPFKGRAIVVRSYMGDPEGYRFAVIVVRQLNEAGIKATAGYWYPDTSPNKELLLGLEIQAPSDQYEFADALQDAFSHTKAGARYRWFPFPEGTPVTIHIGVKPFSLTGGASPAPPGP